MTAVRADFSTETNGPVENSTHWTLGRRAPGSTWLMNFQTDASAPNGKSIKLDTNGWGTQGNNDEFFNDIASTTGQLDAVCQIQVSATLSGLQYPIGLFLIDSTAFVANSDAADTNAQAGYALCYTGSGTWTTYRFDTSGTAVGSGISAASANILTPAANTDFWMRLTRSSGNVIKGKVWGTSYASEPGAYNVNVAGVTDTNITGLIAGVVAQDGNYTVTIRDFAVSTDGDGTASLGGGGGGPVVTHNALLSLGVG